jgi:prepilin-type N-terminal cleavage/methylation domain-containing protein
VKKIVDFIKKLFGSSDSKSSDSSSSGFTLIELLVVIAVIGVLAAAVLIAIDPVQQLARGRDAGRKNSISQVGNSIQTYYTANTAYPTAASGWDTTLTSAGELKVFPADPGGTVTAPACTGGAVASGICYKASATDFVIYSHVESKTEKNKGTCAGVDANTWYVYSSALGRAGVACQAVEPVPGFNGTLVN